MPKAFKDLSEQEILALAISLEEEDGRIYNDFVNGLQKNFPGTAEIFSRMRDEESNHRRQLMELYQQRFGDHIPLIRRGDVKGFVSRKPIWLARPLNLKAVRNQAELMELETRRFYERARARTSDVATRKLLGDLAEAEREHEQLADFLEKENLPGHVREEEEKNERRLFVLQVVQPGLAGLMDGSVSTLAPLFAAAFATHSSWAAFLVGMAASIGAGISMGFAEALSDDGSLSGRGRPYIRGAVCGIMTTIGGIGHTLPFLIPHFYLATTIAVIVVAVELCIIAYIRHRFMDSPLLSAMLQVILGGILVFFTGILIGNS